MIRVAVEVREHTVARRVRITAESIERALELGGDNARIVFPIEPEQFFTKYAGSVDEQSSGSSRWHEKVAA